ncbi:hypothetical protein GHV66_07310 [Pseudomonas aeruginosa]|nr:hypothetical protein [Pseudomonas aeruginosa]MBG6828210.1 hypothetical protein [Pseudomonas aeruginosa]
MTRTTFQGSERDLCAAFIKEFNQVPGWTCYPETAGFDVLVVHEDGRQIGVEAKLKLNAKVADQILPGSWQDRWGKDGPDHRMVIVGTITDASRGISRMLQMLGVSVLEARMVPRQTASGFVDGPTFGLRHWPSSSDDIPFDWNPPERCQVPCIVPDVPAGVPSPLRLTPWKEKAMRVIATMRQQGFITAKQIAEHGVCSTSWTRGAKPWLRPGAVRGQWVETENMPAIDQQHPEAYAQILLAAESKETTS